MLLTRLGNAHGAGCDPLDYDGITSNFHHPGLRVRPRPTVVLVRTSHWQRAPTRRSAGSPSELCFISIHRSGSEPRWHTVPPPDPRIPGAWSRTGFTGEQTGVPVFSQGRLVPITRGPFSGLRSDSECEGLTGPTGHSGSPGLIK